MLPDMFKPFEKDLRRRIREGEAPFLGLFADDFGDHIRRFLHERLARQNLAVEAFTTGTAQFPAIFSSYLVIHLMEGFGEAGHFDVYTHIERALGTPEIGNAQRESLWRHFRSACNYLGLSISPRTSGPRYMVDEYLRQAGFPLQYIPELVLKMLRLAEDVGLPDDDDPDAISLWQQSLLERLRPPFSVVAREAIARDDKGYYVRLFMRVLKNSAEVGGVVEQRIRGAIDAGPATVRTSQRLSIPQILFKDMQLGVLLPGGEGNDWEVRVDEGAARFRAHAADRFVPFDSDLPKQVEIKGARTGLKRSLWEDERDNRFMIFSYPSGRLHLSTSLAEKEAEKEVALNPGRYFLLLRFEPEGIEGTVELLSPDPALYVMALQLAPGEKKCLRRGPAQIVLQADNVPTLEWVGEPIKGLGGTEVYASRGLRLEIALPQEMLGLRGVAYGVTIKPSSLGDDRGTLIKPNEDGKAYLDVEGAAKSWRPGVSRLLAELRRDDSRRVIARSSILFWNGLDHLGRSVFHVQRVPENLIENFCENVLVNGDEGRITYRDDSQRFFRLIFEDDGRHHSLTWAVPGVFLGVEDHGEGGEERSVKVGATIAVTSSSRSVLKVYCSQPATLGLGEFRVRTDFSRVGIKRLPLASLLEYVSPESDSLMLTFDESEVPLKLVELVSPHEVSHFSLSSELDSCDIHLKVQAPLEAIRISAEEIISGDVSAALFDADDLEQNPSREMSAGGWIALFPAGENGYTIYLSMNGWKAGFWILDFQAKIGGRWGALTDRSGNSYSCHLLMARMGQRGVFADLCHGDLEALPVPGLEAVLTRVHHRLLVRYAAECSSLVGHLIAMWNRLFAELQNQSSIDYFISLLVERPSQLVASSWIPSYSIGAGFPELFCYAGTEYAAIKRQNDSGLARCLRVFPEFHNLVTTFSNEVVDMAAASGFANFAHVAAGAALPKGFDLSRYGAALRARDFHERWSALNDDDWRPGAGDYLGPMHYRYAICQTRANYDRSLAENSLRRGRAISLLRRVRNLTLRSFAPAVPAFGTNGFIDLGLFETDGNPCRLQSDTEELHKEQLQWMVRFLSLFAQVCRLEARQRGVLGRFFDHLKERMEFAEPVRKDEELKGVLSYVLYLGEEIFAFYLLLWELVFTADLDVRG